ncbi:MAG: hypothetical protein ABIH04_03365 [Planctomycetota bacterium]
MYGQAQEKSSQKGKSQKKSEKESKEGSEEESKEGSKEESKEKSQKEKGGKESQKASDSVYVLSDFGCRLFPRTMGREIQRGALQRPALFCAFGIPVKPACCLHARRTALLSGIC